MELVLDSVVALATLVLASACNHGNHGNHGNHDNQTPEPSNAS